MMKTEIPDTFDDKSRQTSPVIFGGFSFRHDGDEWLSKSSISHIFISARKKAKLDLDGEEAEDVIYRNVREKSVYWRLDDDYFCKKNPDPIEQTLAPVQSDASTSTNFKRFRKAQGQLSNCPLIDTVSQVIGYTALSAHNFTSFVNDGLCENFQSTVSSNVPVKRQNQEENSLLNLYLIEIVLLEMSL
uniref:Uncharacterized protein n=1 Tax=Romanomermis culicivorax TaxID=13658 RepID=A0A915IFY0_ROMCU